ncbi:YaaA family protein [Bacteroides sp. Phil13]|uniref:YaaA family protein n=1 Tax=Bacteroides sp. Phil13 TaxID=1929999 RepID=UPI000B326D08|nr:YaaA family protein [Bacteroides sp. Phil13]
MRILISPAKKMVVDTDTYAVMGCLYLWKIQKRILTTIKKLSYEEAKALWQCNDKIAKVNYKRFEEMDLKRNLTPAILAYKGLQYQHIAPAVFTEDALTYLEASVRILSGFYGVLSPFDGVVPYRLEMQAELPIKGKKNLYVYW